MTLGADGWDRPAPQGDEPAERKRRGAFYTPAPLADWVAQLVLGQCAAPAPRVADLGCGEGALLQAIARRDASARLIGVELDAAAAARARRNLPASALVVQEDVLAPRTINSVLLADHWRHSLGGEINALIMNPPWGGTHSLTRTAGPASGLTLASGQFDTYDLFCELALDLLPDGGAYGFILPDSLLLPEHRPLRRRLLAQSRIALIARLGEGLFPGVYRGCVVVVGNRGPASPAHRVECLRLTKGARADIASCEAFEVYRHGQSHRVPQSRFAMDAQQRFDIDVSAKDRPVFRISDAGGGWTALLESRRGAEISKHGWIVTCPACGTARPLPRSRDMICRSCLGMLSPGLRSAIVAKRPGAAGRWNRFIVGEDVLRYDVRPSRWIRCDIPGINYKAAARQGRDRLLVRKTGVGLHAALDSSGAYTNQVVFEYVLKEPCSLPFSYLHYVLGVLCSRVMFAYHLKRGGEMEWRSHPYVTQRTLAALPIPVPSPGSRDWRQAAAIAESVEAHLAGRDRELEIEALVAGLYGLTAVDFEWVRRVLDEAADLEPMRRLRLPPHLRLEPRSAA